MAKRVVVISSSPRKGGNSDIMCDEFVKGAVDGGNTATKYFLEDIECMQNPAKRVLPG